MTDGTEGNGPVTTESASGVAEGVAEGVTGFDRTSLTVGDSVKDFLVSTGVDVELFPRLIEFTDVVTPPVRTLVGRDEEAVEVLSNLGRPEVSNVMLLGDAGSGKSSLVEKVMMSDPNRVYLEVDASKLVGGEQGKLEAGSRIKGLFDDAARFVRMYHTQVVLFIDEIHQLVMASPSAVEALKPGLAKSGYRGTPVIGATTYAEYHDWIEGNEPLRQRLQTVNLGQLGHDQVVSSLNEYAVKYSTKYGFKVPDESVFEQIYTFTERYQPRAVQPRKSLLLLDGMIGRHRETGEPFDMKLLAKVLKTSTGIDVGFKVNGQEINGLLNRHVFGQQYATEVVSRRLQVSVAGLNDKDKPESSFLFTGSTGVGKEVMDYERIPVYLPDGSVSWKKNGDLEIGDYVFDRIGEPTKVLGVFPQGEKTIYRVTLTDGRTVDVGAEHLWTVYTDKMRSNKHAGKYVEPKVMQTKDMVDAGVVRTYPGDDRRHLKFFIPANGAVQWPEAELSVDPYVMGVLVGNGSLREPQLTVSSDDEYTVRRVAESFDVSVKKLSDKNYGWAFPTGEKHGSTDVLVQTKSALVEYSDLIGCYSSDRRIPEQFMISSVEQRWELVRGLFDTDGSIDKTSGRFNVSYSTFSEGLAQDVRSLLFSLGVSNTVNTWTRERDGRMMVEYAVHVSVSNEQKADFFALPRKKNIAEDAVAATAGRSRVKKFDMVGIADIEVLDQKEHATCIYVDNDEHLYQAGEFIVTHNTELTKAVSQVLFKDLSHFIRFDMSEFGAEESVKFFQDELTRRVSDMGHAVILFDEIEKAHPSVWRMLLQVLDDGRMRDSHGRQVSFKNTYIILTTNAASEIYEVQGDYASTDDGYNDRMKEQLSAVQRSLTTAAGFPKELLGRVDEIVPFSPLSDATKTKIIKRKMAEIALKVRRIHGVFVEYSGDVLTYVAEDMKNNGAAAGGARDAVRTLQHEVTSEVAMYLNAHPDAMNIYVFMSGVLKTGNKQHRISHAKVSVRDRR